MKAGQGKRAPAAGILRLPLQIRGELLALLRAAEPAQSQPGFRDRGRLCCGERSKTVS